MKQVEVTIDGRVIGACRPHASEIVAKRTGDPLTRFVMDNLHEESRGGVSWVLVANADDPCEVCQAAQISE